MKKYLLFSLVLFLWICSIPQKTYAHFPQTDGDIQVTLHIEPDDNPIPGDPATLYFIFEDAVKKFQLKNCDCRISLIEQNKTLLSQKLSSQKLPHSVYTSGASFIFPVYDVYKITLTGRPTFKNAFQPFTLSWYFRVDPDTPGEVQGLSDIQIILLVMAALIIFGVLFGLFLKKEVLDREKVDITKKSRYTQRRK